MKISIKIEDEGMGNVCRTEMDIDWGEKCGSIYSVEEFRDGCKDILDRLTNMYADDLMTESLEKDNPIVWISFENSERFAKILAKVSEEFEGLQMEACKMEAFKAKVKEEWNKERSLEQKVE